MALSSIGALLGIAVTKNTPFDNFVYINTIIKGAIGMAIWVIKNGYILTICKAVCCCCKSKKQERSTKYSGNEDDSKERDRPHFYNSRRVRKPSIVNSSDISLQAHELIANIDYKASIFKEFGFKKSFSFIVLQAGNKLVYPS